MKRGAFTFIQKKNTIFVVYNGQQILFSHASTHNPSKMRGFYQTVTSRRNLSVNDLYHYANRYGMRAEAVVTRLNYD